MLEGFGRYEIGGTLFYSGEFKQNLEHGYGILTAESFVYYGNFQNGLFDG